MINTDKPIEWGFNLTDFGALGWRAVKRKLNLTYAGRDTTNAFYRGELAMPTLHVKAVIQASDVPLDCVHQCTRDQEITITVSHWRARLGLQVSRAQAIKCLIKHGGWQRHELDECDNGTLWTRVLWLACHAFARGEESFRID